ncbi:GAD-like domain-containing protein [Pseudoduganella sp. R-34]|uniref:GAD-like domain-containing protein n=1 Tax=unclassified Pseudoduganella TaxID=2637179 RepID=UPI003CF578F5
MDEHFELFLEEMGPAIDKRPVPPSSIERFRGKLPSQLLAYWEEHGWCGYADGLFWTVDPQEYEPVLDAWIGDTEFIERDAYHIIARSAFGGLYFWGERTCDSLTVFAPGTYCFPHESIFQNGDINLGLRTFFGVRDRNENDFDDMFSGARKKLGQLKHDEMYGFVPALALGGPAPLSHLKKVKAVEHLVFLAQLAPLEVMTPHSLADF